VHVTLLHAVPLLVVVKCVTVNVMSIALLYQRSKLGDRIKTQHSNAKTEQFITAKISGTASKQCSRTHSVLCQRSSQMQKYKAAHPFKSHVGHYSGLDISGHNWPAD